MNKQTYTKEEVIRIVANFARSYNTDTFLGNGETLEEAILKVKDLIDWDVIAVKPKYPKTYIDEKFCKHCEEDTNHEITEFGHERDSSADTFMCLVCHWHGSGMFGEYLPPSTE